MSISLKTVRISFNMKLLVCYSLPYNDWYVGEFYRSFFNFLKNKGHDVEHVTIEDLCKRFNGNLNYTNNIPSVFNIFNLLLINEKNNKTFIHSWSDYAPVILDLNYESGIKNFDVVKFSCVSGLTQENFDRFNKNFKIQPSFYQLENFSDHIHIEKYKNNQKHIKKIFFNGLNYGKRQYILEKLKKSDLFNIKIKNISSDWQQKNDYYDTLSNHKYALGLDGAALICYRDLEAFGMGNLLFREKIQNLFYEPLIENVHYFNIFDDYLYSVIYNNDDLFINHINEKVNNILSLSENNINDVINNARGWFERNCLVESQQKLMYSFLDELAIFE